MPEHTTTPDGRVVPSGYPRLAGYCDTPAGPIPCDPVAIPQFKTVKTGVHITPSGAQCDPIEDKPRYELIPRDALRRVAQLYSRGAKIRGARNWETGIPDEIIDSKLLRHLMQALDGETDEDHLAAVVFWALAKMHFQEKARACTNQTN